MSKCDTCDKKLPCTGQFKQRCENNGYAYYAPNPCVANADGNEDPNAHERHNKPTYSYPPYNLYGGMDKSTASMLNDALSQTCCQCMDTADLYIDSLANAQVQHIQTQSGCKIRSSNQLHSIGVRLSIQQSCQVWWRG